MTTNFPITPTRLSQIASDACTSTLATAASYQHDSTAAWNNSIINKILQALISETSTSTTTATSEDAPAAPSSADTRYKFAVNSTIIQHLSDARAGDEHDKLSPTEDAGGEARKVGRRGMHSASGAYWNNERDGMWSYKFEGGESKGMDIVVSVMWIGV